MRRSIARPAMEKTQATPTSTHHFLMQSSTAEEWKVIVSTLQNLTEEAAFDVDSSGISFRAMDPSHIALIDLFWDAAAFEKFEAVEKDRFAVRVEDFAKIIKRAEKSDSVSISRSGSDALLIKMGTNREFEFHLLESTISSVPLPKLSLASKFTIDKKAFESVLEDISALSNHITIRADPSSSGGMLSFSCKGDAGNAKIVFTKDQLVDFQSPQQSEAVYSLEYIQKVLKPASSSSDVVEFSFGSKMPLSASVSVGDPSKSGRLKLSFFLAPRTSD